MEHGIILDGSVITSVIAERSLRAQLAGLDELLFAGFLRRKSIELVRCKTIDLEVPADVDFVLEGYVQPGDMRPEGPFGDHTGFYTAIEDYPVFHLTAITHRRDAIYPTTIVGIPPMELSLIHISEPTRQAE